MKRVFSILSILALIFMFVNTETKAQDGAFGDALTLGPGQFALGIQPIFYTETSNDEFMLMIRGEYGLQSGLSFSGKLGLLRDETYFGGHIKFLLAGEPGDPISFSLLGGAYSFGDIGLKLGGILSKRIGDFSLYSGLNYEPLFTDDILNPLTIPVGLDIPITSGSFIFEADIAANDEGNIYQALHAGLNFRL